VSTENFKTRLTSADGRGRPIFRGRCPWLFLGRIENETQDIIRCCLESEPGQPAAPPIHASVLPGRFPGAQPYVSAACSIRLLRERQGCFRSEGEDETWSR